MEVARTREHVFVRNLDADTLVMLGLVPGIHVFLPLHGDEDVDGRVTGERKRRRSSNGYARP
jgi:hypothetical protein